MAYFYRDGDLKVGSENSFQSVTEIARQHETPLYIYDVDDIEMRYRAYVKSFCGLNTSIHYAMKANSNVSLLARLAGWGAGVDTVSAGEIRKAIEAGFSPSKIIFSGVAKTKKEIAYAVSKQIKQINVESPAELERIISIARVQKKRVDVAFRLNPDVNPKTHPYITTGFRENKFGMDESFLPELIAQLRAAEDAVRLRGLTMHIGSLLFDLDVMRDAAEKTLAVHHRLVKDGFELDRFDIGGGLGIRYETDDATEELAMLEQYGVMARDVIAKHFGTDAKIEILCEPGRMIVARSGLLVSEVQYIKRAPAKTFAIVDTGMHHLLRPALYQAKHRVLSLRISEGVATQIYDVVGPICESSDVIAKSIELPQIHAGDLIGVADTGAYGFAMASTYNSHALPQEIFVEKGQVATLHQAETKVLI